ncbi:hypothetical protein MRX96_020346 [Rhipicephalus microplus]
MPANVVFTSCALLRLGKSTTDITTSTHGRITVLPGLARGAFLKVIQKKTAPLDWHQSRSGSRAGTLANAALFLLQAMLRKLSSTVCKKRGLRQLCTTAAAQVYD